MSTLKSKFHNYLALKKFYNLLKLLSLNFIDILKRMVIITGDKRNNIIRVYGSKQAMINL